MNITTISFSVSRTVSLREYSNVKLGITLDADLADGDDLHQALNALRDVAQGYVEEECNQALEFEGQPAKFYRGPRYKILYCDALDAVFIAGEHVDHNGFPGSWNAFYEGHRWQSAVTLAEQFATAHNATFSPSNILNGEPDAILAKVREMLVSSTAVAVLNLGWAGGRRGYAFAPVAFAFRDEFAADLMVWSERLVDEIVAEGVYDVQYIIREEELKEFLKTASRF